MDYYTTLLCLTSYPYFICPPEAHGALHIIFTSALELCSCLVYTHLPIYTPDKMLSLYIAHSETRKFNKFSPTLLFDIWA